MRRTEVRVDLIARAALLVAAAALPVLVPRAQAQTQAQTQAQAQPPLARQPPTAARVLAESKPSDWRPLDPQNTLYMQLPPGRVVIELAPRFAPRYVANIKKLVREHYFDGLSIYRVQDNFVAEWGDPAHTRPLGTAEKTLPAEFIVSSKDVPFTALPDPDTYAPEVGFAGEFPAARDPKIGREWLVHCYG
ncbi:MAG: peptidylprolyl isomerase, partial [Steroidobacteraceae bacterium]